MADDDVIELVRGFILDEFLEGEDPAFLQTSTSLISTGVIDSVSTLKLVIFLEKTFGIVVEPHEADIENLDSLAAIRAFVGRKR